MTALRQFCQKEWAKIPANYCEKLQEEYFRCLTQDIQFKVIQPSIHLVYQLLLYKVTGELVPISSGRRARGRLHPGQVGDTQEQQPCTHPFTPKGNLERPINLV
ncbi:hypothetical protein AMECASPLE_024322 [Ameca splendens]|uniref:Uncharacterized protein n=1 Tax=Ameca splendens TaxID=208324 RepID=A0ABV0Y489_9TELE